MAYRKKGAKSSSRRSYRRRYTRRRRYRRKYPRRSGRRFPKGTEVKSKSADVNGSVTPTFTEASGSSYINFIPGKYITIGGSNDNFNIQIPPGTSQGQRVGAKIEPIKLRVSGSFQVDDTTLGITNPPNFWQVRCIIYQVKGGNANAAPNASGYHPLGFIGSDGNATTSDIRKILCNYESSGDSGQFNEDQWRRNNFFAKVPFRRGIGGTCRILYKKSFWINAQKNPIKQFRFVCKTPKRLVYPEGVNGPGDSTFNVANNVIYIVFLWQPGSFQQECVPTLHYSMHIDLYYTDK